MKKNENTLEIKTPRWALPLLTPSRYKAIYGGRGSGKSHFLAELMIESHIINPNQRSVCIREIQKSLDQSVKLLLEIKIKELNVESYFQIQERVIKSKKGSGLIIFQGMQNHTADSLKSLEGYECAWVEEAQSLSQKSLDLLRPTIRQEGSEIWFSWNPRLETDPVDNFFRVNTPPPSSTIVQVNFSQNPFFPQVLKDEMTYDKKRDIDKYLHVWLGEYLKNSEARVFKNWCIDEFDAPPDAVHRFGADWGFAVDPTALIRCHVVGRNLFVDYEAYSVGCEIADTPALFLTIPESEKWTIVADSSRPETISHMRNNGFPKILGAVKGPNSVVEGIEFLKNYDIIVHPRCKHTIDELSLYSYKIDSLTNKILPVLSDKKNHVIDALRYACENIRRVSAKKVEYSPPPAVTNFW